MLFKISIPPSTAMSARLAYQMHTAFDIFLSRLPVDDGLQAHKVHKTTQNFLSLLLKAREKSFNQQ